jgi:hypothetical protein
MERPAKRCEKTRLMEVVSRLEALVCTAAILAGAWFTSEKKAKTEVDVDVHNQIHNGGVPWMVTAPNTMILVGDGDGFIVMPRH